jgi:hypothetical protein
MAYDPNAPKQSFFEKERERLVEEISAVRLAQLSKSAAIYPVPCYPMRKIELTSRALKSS